MGRMIGIDLGTTNSCVAVMEGDKPTVIINANGERTTPSVVGFTKAGERLVGTPAKRQSAVNPDRTIYSIKRDMGTDKRIRIDSKAYSPQEISAMILGKLKADAEAYLGEPVTEAVITVPAYFTDSQRQATKDAGTIAGLDVRRIINEPTAAALSYGVDREEDREVMVYDLGGGTFDVSILSIESGFIKVISTAGDNHLGGDDFDERLVNHVCDSFKREQGIDLRRDTSALQRVREACEQAKCELSGVQSTMINLPFITTKDGAPLHLECTVTRAEFERMVGDLVDRTLGPVKSALEDAGVKPTGIGKVLMVGGSSRMPCVQEAIKSLTGREPNKDINPDEAVALGACLQSGVLSGTVGGLVLMDVTPLSLGVELRGDLMSVIIDRNSAIPTSHSEIYTTASALQNTVEINVLQGERGRASENKSLGKFRLGGIKRGFTKAPQIEVTFEIDSNGIVHVTAKDLGTNKSADIQIEGSSNLSQAEIDQARRDAAEHAAEDARHAAEAEVINEAEALMGAAQEALKAKDSTLDKEEKKRIRTLCKQIQKSIKAKDIDAIKSDCAELQALIG